MANMDVLTKRGAALLPKFNAFTGKCVLIPSKLQALFS